MVGSIKSGQMEDNVSVLTQCFKIILSALLILSRQMKDIQARDLIKLPSMQS